MSDRHIQQAKYLAGSEDSLEAWLLYEHTLERYGQHPTECFDHIIALQAEELKRLDAFKQQLRDGLREEARRKFKQLFPDKRASGKDWRRVYDYVSNDYQQQIEGASEQQKEIREDHRLRRNATRFGSGAMIMYNNPKARAKFEDGEKEKVPCFTFGTVIWTGQTEWGWRVGVKTPEGRTFYSARQNFNEEVLNAWFRYAESREKDDSKDTYEEDVAYMKQVFGTTLKRGDSVCYKGSTVDVVWCGRNWRTKSLRVGIRPTRQARAIWVDIREVSLV